LTLAYFLCRNVLLMSSRKASADGPAPPRSTRASTGWLPGLVLGAIGGLLSISFAVGILALPFLALAIALIAWKGPRLLAGGGLLTGHGLMWLVLLLRVQLTCGAAAVFADDSCESTDLTGWIAVGATIFVVGLVMSAVGVKRARLAARGTASQLTQ
jgi:hypothetical protein